MTKAEAPNAERQKAKAAVLHAVVQKSREADSDKVYFSDPELGEMADIFGIDVSSSVRECLDPQLTYGFETTELRDLKDEKVLKKHLEAQLRQINDLAPTIYNEVIRRI